MFQPYSDVFQTTHYILQEILDDFKKDNQH